MADKGKSTTKANTDKKATSTRRPKAQQPEPIKKWLVTWRWAQGDNVARVDHQLNRNLRTDVVEDSLHDWFVMMNEDSANQRCIVEFAIPC